MLPNSLRAELRASQGEGKGSSAKKSCIQRFGTSLVSRDPGLDNYLRILVFIVYSLTGGYRR